jgi:hypothetical protein
MESNGLCSAVYHNKSLRVHKHVKEKYDRHEVMSRWNPGLGPRLVHVEFVDKVAMGQVSFRALRFSPLNVTALLPHIQSCNI